MIYFLIYFNIPIFCDKEVSQQMNGLLSFSTGQSSPLKSDAFSALKRNSKEIVARKFEGANLLCSAKNCSLFK
jgi:hypothetical protein